MQDDNDSGESNDKEKTDNGMVYFVCFIVCYFLIGALSKCASPSNSGSDRVFAPSTRQAVRDSLERAEIDMQRPLTDEEIESIAARTQYNATR